MREIRSKFFGSKTWEGLQGEAGVVSVSSRIFLFPHFFVDVSVSTFFT